MFGVSKSEKEKFVQDCLDQYEELMDGYFYSSVSVSEFEQSHNREKPEVISQLRMKWKDTFGSKKMSSSIADKVAEALDKSFGRLKRHFEHSKQKNNDQGPDKTSKENAMKYYVGEMEKYMDGTDRRDQNGLTNAHSIASVAATKLVKEFQGVSIRAVTDLKTEMEECLKMFSTRLDMDNKAKSDPTIGIDLGTTMCCVMVYYNGKVEVIPNRAQGNSRTTPSYVAYFEDGEDNFGSVAKEEAYRYPETTVYDAKRMIGRPWSDTNLQNDRKHWPFEVVKDKEGAKIKTWGQSRYPHEVSARLLAQFRLMADEHLDLPLGTVSKAVITVPAYFTEPQRRATSEAATCAGLDVLQILSEPTAAAIAYSWNRRNKNESRKALIYDLGGGTFDIVVALVEPDRVEILAVDGDTHLGGQDFDQLLMNHCISQFLETEGIDLLKLKGSATKQTRDGVRTALARLKFQCERAKERLSTALKTTINVDMLYDGKHLAVTVTRETLDQLIKPLVQKTLDIVDRAMAEVKSKGIKNHFDIDDLILIGGSTRVPLVENMLSMHFNGKQLCKHINPDEAVAFGAAIQAAISRNVEMIQPIKVQDVTPMTLGLAAFGDKFEGLIAKNSKIPLSVSSCWTSPVDNITKMKCTVLQGEYKTASDNKLLGEFWLRGFPPKPQGEESAVVTMTIDANGLLHVEGFSPTTGKSDGITITSDRLGIEADRMEGLKKEVDDSARRHFSGIH